MRTSFYNGPGFFSLPITCTKIWTRLFSTIKYMTSSEEFNERKLWVICNYFVSVPVISLKTDNQHFRINS